jgi:catechol 2,3-dioxygenase-like lactoylglutathione lyase family enzyme
MSEIYPPREPRGSPLYSAIIGTDSLSRSVSYYRDVVGLDVLAEGRCEDHDFRAHWSLPAGTRADIAVLGNAKAEVGRVTLMEFQGVPRAPIRTEPGQRFYGLVNLNFYTDDIERHTEEHKSRGFHPWTEPIKHAMDPNIGSPTEVMIEGPDGVIVNLVQLTGGAPGSATAQMLAYVRDEFGFNRAGLTPIVTSQQLVPDIDRAIDFYRRVLGMDVFFDTILWRDELNVFMDYPPGSRTRCVFVRGSHHFGKIALNHPLNQEFENLVPKSVPGAIGYFAQSFLVEDLDAALESARAIGTAIYSPPIATNIPGLGRARTAVVRNSGSGVLQELIEHTVR